VGDEQLRAVAVVEVPDVLAATHDADITAETIIPPWYGERLDLDHAIYVCFANARTGQDKQEARDQAGGGGVTVYEPEDWPERIRRYYAETEGRPRTPVLVPIQV
jgi:hypothetical protein